MADNLQQIVDAKMMNIRMRVWVGRIIWAGIGFGIAYYLIKNNKIKI